MQVTTVYCDKCSRVITADRTELFAECGPLRQRGRESIDLCLACLDSVMALIDAPSPALASPPASEPTTAVNPAPGLPPVRRSAARPTESPTEAHDVLQAL